ncbi:MAG: 50S ribosomal protein L21e [Candidatus Woesearchaeota archaeon]|jgi:large subunit ribosomal protein L21e|nr:50S ribosomal protein L21e [Candidatus Woesearchaeota archaeon]
MAQRIGGFRRQTRYKLQKHFRKRGKISIPKYLQIFKLGDRVVLHAEPAVQKGMYHPRFHGKVAVVKSKRGTNYEVELKDGGKLKTLIVHPVHLEKNG